MIKVRLQFLIKIKSNICQFHNVVLEKVESESENGEDEEMDEEPSTESDETGKYFTFFVKADMIPY